MTAPTPSDPGSSDNLRAQYAAAVQMAVYDGQLSWQITGLFVQFAILMVVGAIFPSFVWVSTSKPLLGAAGGLVALGGLVMASMFGSMSLRIRTYQDLWVARAEDLEHLLGPPGVLSSGSELSRVGLIQIGQTTLRMRRVSSVKTKTVMSWLFGMFAVVFLALLVFNLLFPASFRACRERTSPKASRRRSLPLDLTVYRLGCVLRRPLHA